MGKILAVVLVIIALAVGISDYRQQICDAGRHFYPWHLIDDQLHDTMWEAGLSFHRCPIGPCLFRLVFYQSESSAVRLNPFPAAPKSWSLPPLSLSGRKSLHWV